MLRRTKVERRADFQRSSSCLAARLSPRSAGQRVLVVPSSSPRCRWRDGIARRRVARRRSRPGRGQRRRRRRGQRQTAEREQGFGRAAGGPGRRASASRPELAGQGDDRAGGWFGEPGEAGPGPGAAIGPRSVPVAVAVPPLAALAGARSEPGPSTSGRGWTRGRPFLRTITRGRRPPVYSGPGLRDQRRREPARASSRVHRHGLGAACSRGDRPRSCRHRVRISPLEEAGPRTAVGPEPAPLRRRSRGRQRGGLDRAARAGVPGAARSPGSRPSTPWSPRSSGEAEDFFQVGGPALRRGAVVASRSTVTSPPRARRGVPGPRPRPPRAGRRAARITSGTSRSRPARGPDTTSIARPGATSPAAPR